MDIEHLKDQLDWIQARMEEMDKLVINGDPTQRGYEELLKNLNKLTDRYNEIFDEIKHCNDPNIEAEKLEIEKMKLKFDTEKLKIEQEIAQDKNNLELEQIRLDREKFAFEVQESKKKDIIDIIFKTGELIVKLAVPIIGFKGITYVSNLSYMNEEEMKLRNGNIAGGVKDILSIMRMKG